MDRRDINQLLSEQNLATAGRVDAATAAKIGKLVGARYMILGSFVDFYGDFRVDARIVDVETSEILKVVSSRKDRNKLFDIIQTVAVQIMTDVKLPPLTGAQTSATKRDIPTDALTYYSRALLYQDRGENAKAAEYFRKALVAFPGYTEADEGLKKVSPA